MKRIYTTINKKGNLNDISKEELLKIKDSIGAEETNNQNNINRIPSATYSELGVTPESTIEEKQIAIATFLEGYDNAETDNLFFEIKEDTTPVDLTTYRATFRVGGYNYFGDYNGNSTGASGGGVLSESFNTNTPFDSGPMFPVGLCNITDNYSPDIFDRTFYFRIENLDNPLDGQVDLYAQNTSENALGIGVKSVNGVLNEGTYSIGFKLILIDNETDLEFPIELSIVFNISNNN